MITRWTWLIFRQLIWLTTTPSTYYLPPCHDFGIWIQITSFCYCCGRWFVLFFRASNNHIKHCRDQLNWLESKLNFPLPSQDNNYASDSNLNQCKNAKYPDFKTVVRTTLAHFLTGPQRGNRFLSHSVVNHIHVIATSQLIKARNCPKNVNSVYTPTVHPSNASFRFISTVLISMQLLSDHE